jgi:hypothetical protein
MMTQTEPVSISPVERTNIYKLTAHGEDHVGFVGSDGVIYKVRWESAIPIGRIETREEEIHLFRKTRHDEKGVGSVDNHGAIFSYGLFEGGELGWLDPDGVVVQGGLILGEEEVGRVEGPQANAAAAALLLIFLPEDAEASREMAR